MHNVQIKSNQNLIAAQTLFHDQYLFHENVKKKDYSIAHQREAAEYGEIHTAKCEKLNKIKFKIGFHLFPQTPNAKKSIQKRKVIKN